MRHLRKRIEFRVNDKDMGIIDAAIHVTNESWRGKSHFARAALMHWARGMLSQVRAQAIREKVQGK